MQITLEQTQILNYVKSSNSDFKISAFAGAGKTSTLRLIAKELPKLSFLYLAFNKDIKKEAEKSFTSNVYCTTYHALARKAMQIDQTEYCNKLKRVLKASDIIKKLKIENLYKNSSYTLLNLTRKTLSNFKNSSLLNFDESIIDLEGISQLTNIPSEQSKIALSIHKLAYKMWQLETDPKNEFSMDHDTYLKMWHLSEPVIDVDVILFDEAQDANPVVLDIVKMQSARKIFVGDSHQSIYSWRGAINAMDQLELKELPLTQSFRFGSKIADFANSILIKKGERRKLRGFEKISSLIHTIDKSKCYTHLCRTNAEIIQQAIHYTSEKKNIHIIGTEAEIFRKCYFAYLLFANKKHEIPNSEYKYYKNWEDFKTQNSAHAENNIIIKIVSKYTQQLPSILNEIKKFMVSENEANVLLCSAHKSKGLQWRQVLIANDFSLKTNEEINLFYVACTRAISVLDVSPCSNLLKEINKL